MESEEQERKLFVGGLNKNLTDEDSLRAFFIKYGGIIDCTIMRDADKQSRGFGFVLFDSSSSVDEIITIRKDGKVFTLDDHHIEVKRALPKVPGGTAGSSRTGGLYRKIFVGGLPNVITDDDLKKYFERFGRVVETELLRDRETNRLRGFAFVTFDDEDSADKCIQRRTHEICKKLCEVKRAQTRSNIKHDDDDFRGGNRYGGGRDRDDRHGPSSGGLGGLGSNELNQLIQQAYLMGQQSVMNSAIQPPTAASLLNQLNPSPYAQNAPAANPALLQALINQQSAPAQAAPPMPQPQVQQPVVAGPGGNTNQLANQIAQLLQGRGGVDPNALNALIKPEENRQGAAKPPAQNGSYSTSYPASSTYDMYYNQNNAPNANYGPAKEDGDNKRYRPY
ncbi:heterogeneous nuclear ribonucleoprotein A1-like 2 isoform X4 [Clytia hemisphaerica]|uniref:RRM domain-containing protein n=1 Tax=Clytia hemisphaerica TaxID=252671 RepID=A0A7M5UXK8_9CNID